MTEKAVKVIKEEPERIIGTMVKRKMAAALEFLASLKQVPLHIRNEAYKAAEKLKPAAPLPVEKEKPAVKEEKAAAPFELKEFPRSKEYTPWQLEALLSGLGSVERVRAVFFAVQFLKNYEPISKAVSKAASLRERQAVNDCLGEIDRSPLKRRRSGSADPW